MSARARIIVEPREPRLIEQANVYGASTIEEAHAAIAKALPEPGNPKWTRESWASQFYDTGVNSGRGRVWRSES